jgi:hypothetical protein
MNVELQGGPFGKAFRRAPLAEKDPWKLWRNILGNG